MTSEAELHALLRQDFYSFSRKVFHSLHPATKLEVERYLELVCQDLTAAANSEILRLAISMPPRHLKSILASVALPAFILGRNPAAKIMVLSHDQALAKEFSVNCPKS